MRAQPKHSRPSRFKQKPDGLWNFNNEIEGVSGNKSVVGLDSSKSIGIFGTGVKVTGSTNLDRYALNGKTNIDNIGSGDFSVVATFRLDDQTVDGYGVIMRGNSTTIDWSLGSKDGFKRVTEPLTASISVKVGSNFYHATCSQAWTAGRHYTLIGRRKGTTIYITSYEHETKVATWGATTNAGITTVNFTAGMKLKLGEDYPGATYNSYITVFSAAIYKRFLSDEVIKTFIGPWVHFDDYRKIPFSPLVAVIISTSMTSMLGFLESVSQAKISTSTNAVSEKATESTIDNKISPVIGNDKLSESIQSQFSKLSTSINSWIEKAYEILLNNKTANSVNEERLIDLGQTSHAKTSTSSSIESLRESVQAQLSKTTESAITTSESLSTLTTLLKVVLTSGFEVLVSQENTTNLKLAGSQATTNISDILNSAGIKTAFSEALAGLIASENTAEVKTSDSVNQIVLSDIDSITSEKVADLIISTAISGRVDIFELLISSKLSQAQLMKSLGEAIQSEAGKQINTQLIEALAESNESIAGKSIDIQLSSSNQVQTTIDCSKFIDSVIVASLAEWIQTQTAKESAVVIETAVDELLDFYSKVETEIRLIIPHYEFDRNYILQAVRQIDSTAIHDIEKIDRLLKSEIDRRFH